MKKFFTSAVLLAAALFTANAQQLQTGDSFEFTNADGVTKTYKVVGENLIENPSFDNGTDGWTGGGGGTLGSTEVNYSGGVDGGAYIRPTSSSGKGDNNSIGTAWDVEVGKTYVFSFFLKNQTNTAAESPAGDGYIKVSMSNTYRDETLVLQPLPHVDADLAWTQNTWVVTAEYSSLALCARWLGGSKCFDAFILAEVEELADAKELEDLLVECSTWMDHFGDDAKEYETISALAGEAQELIDGGEYTASELNAMVHNLKETLLDFRVANANDENPVDVTERYIKNTKFDNSWTGWDVVNAAVNNGMNIRNFAYFEPGLNPVAEINGAPSTEASISQTVYGLPMGYYRFTVQAVMSHSVDVNDPEAKSGAIIFCNGSELDMVTKEQTAGGAANDASYPETFTIEGIVSADSMIVGFKGIPGASFTYVAIDNVKLEYAGFDADIYIEALADQVMDWVAENGDYLLPAIGYSLEEEVSEAEDALGGTDEEITAAYKKLDAAFAKAKESVELMKQLEQDYAEFTAYVEETAFPGMDEALAVVTEIDTFLGLEDEEASYDELYAIIAKLEQTKNSYLMSQEATKETPADYTFLLPNAEFEAQGNWTWTVNGGGTDTWVGNCRPAMEGGESIRGVNLWGWGLTSIDLHQEISGLPEGLYSISADLITQAGYATDQHVYVSSINKAVSANLEVEGWDTYEWTTLTTGYVVVVEGGTLTVGAESSIGGDNSEGWFQASNFKLYYHGKATAEDLQAAYEATLAEAQAVVAELLKGDAAVLQAKIDEAIALSATSSADAAALLIEPITTAKAALSTYNSYKNGAYQTVVDNAEALTTDEAKAVLNAAIAFADAITSADATTSADLAAIETKLNAYNDYATYLEEVVFMTNDRKAGYAAANIADVKAAIEAQKADLIAEFQSQENITDLKSKLEYVVNYLVKSSFMNIKAGDDVTALILNPTLDTDAAGWIVNKGKGNTETNAGQHWSAVADNRYMDSWSGSGLNFHASQVLTDIPNGTYTVKVATRSSAAGAFIFALGEAIASEEVNDSTVMLQVANSSATKWVEIVASADTMGGIWQAEEDKWAAGNTYDETIHNANNGKGFGWSWATIDDIVVTNHEMVIGATTDSLVSKVPFQGTWFSVDDWSLTIKEVGDNSDWSIESGINSVATTVKETTIFAIDGRRLSTAAKGVNIVKTVYSDGSIEVKKVFVK